MGRILRFSMGCLVVACLTLPVLVFGAGVKDVLDRPALKVVNPDHVVLVDVTRAGNRLVAVGERGVIILSDDAGDTWHQAHVPAGTTLTAVAFPTHDQGWAVGHSGVVLHTTDGGQSWHRQLDGITAARMALETAQAAAGHTDSNGETAGQMVHNAELLVADGPDKPFLDLNFKSEQEGIIIGAYGLIFSTTDGGQSWQCLMDRVENPRGLNLYAIRAFDDAMYIAGEQGLFLVSRDKGNSFQKMQTPYSGTFFDLAVTSSGDVVIVGLRGNAYWSTDQGATFNQTRVPVEVSFTAVTQLEDGTLLFANQAGMLLASRDGGRSLQLTDIPRLGPISGLIPAGNGSLMTVGYGGAIRVRLPSSGSMENKGGPQ